MSKKFETNYYIEAYLAVNPRSPGWGHIAFTGVTGWEQYREDPRVVGPSWRFRTHEDAVAVFRELRKYEQQHYLRVVRESVCIDVEVLAGADIEEGTIVDGPGDKPASARSPFWRVDDETLRGIVPADRILDVVTVEATKP